MTDRDGRFVITREKYLSSLDPKMSDEARAVVDDLIEWSHENNLIDDFSDGERGPAFTPRIQRTGKRCGPVSVQADGWIVIRIARMNDRPPFSDPAKCQELIDRIKEIPNSVITDKGDRGFPKFPVASLIESDKFGEVIEILDWIIDEIKAADGAPPERKIWVYGNPDKSDLGFPTESDITQYIKGGVFSTEDGRYRQSQRKNANVIVLSRDGLAFGYFEIEKKLDPNEDDRKAYPPVKSVYLVSKTALYFNPVRLADVHISGIQFGRKITEEVFKELLDRAGGIEEYQKPKTLPTIEPDGPAADEISKTTTQVAEAGYFSPASLKDEREKKLREIVERRGQPEFRKKLIFAYGSRCAVTGCDAVAALEAAHIVPYSGPQSHHVTNGLLLRADIHTLFDLDLIGINPESLTISVSTAIKATEYAELQGQKLFLPDDATESPNHDALKQRWERFGGESDS